VMSNASKTRYRPATVPGKQSRRLRVALLVLGVAGCSNQAATQAVVGGGTKQVTVEYPLDGFLPHPELLYAGGAGQPGLVYFKPGFSFTNYNAILLDPVTIVSDPNSDLATASPKQRETLANLYYSELYNALKPHCNLVRHAGPGTLRLTVALTDAKTSNGTVKTLATYTPYVMIAYKAGSVAFNGGAGYFSGTATSEAYATDSRTNDLLWQGADKRAGSVALVQNTTNSWNDVDNAMKDWSQQALTRLQALGACRS